MGKMQDKMGGLSVSVEKAQKTMPGNGKAKLPVKATGGAGMKGTGGANALRMNLAGKTKG